VLIAQTTVLADQQILNNLQVQQMTATVALLEALGAGGIIHSCRARNRRHRNRPNQRRPSSR